MTNTRTNRKLAAIPHMAFYLLGERLKDIPRRSGAAFIVLRHAVIGQAARLIILRRRLAIGMWS